MKLSYIINALEAYAPRALQEKWDNTGLQVGLPAGTECTGVLICVDVTPEVVSEAVRRGCNLIVSHHPLIFKGLKSLTGRTFAEITAYEAVRAGVAIYSSHTALDSTRGGVSYAMARKLGATPLKVLSPVEIRSCNVTVICPRKDADDVRLALFELNAGQPMLAANSEFSDAAPKVSAQQPSGTESDVNAWNYERYDDPVPSFELIHTPLTRISATINGIPASAIRSALAGLPSASDLRIDITEETAFDPGIGLGIIAEFPEAITMAQLTERLHKAFGTPAIRANDAAADGSAMVQKIAMCGGSGGEFIGAAAAAGAQAYISADIRYHDFADNRQGMAIFDIGHYESETCSKDVIYDVLSKKFSNFAVDYAECDANPVKYL